MSAGERRQAPWSGARHAGRPHTSLISEGPPKRECDHEVLEIRVRADADGYIIEADLISGELVLANMKLPALRADGHSVEVSSLRGPTLVALVGTFAHSVSQALA